MSNEIQSVSYTHLDVYKRQERERVTDRQTDRRTVIQSARVRTVNERRFSCSIKRYYTTC